MGPPNLLKVFLEMVVMATGLLLKGIKCVHVALEESYGSDTILHIRSGIYTQSDRVFGGLV